MTMTTMEKDRHGLTADDDRKARFNGKNASSEAPKCNMPNNVEAEAAVIGAVMFDNRAFDRISELVSESDFYVPQHQIVWRTVATMINQGQVVSGVTLREHFERDEALKTVGGAEYLGALLDAAAFGPEIQDYARMVHTDAQRRRVIEAAQESIQAAHALGASPTALLSKAREGLDAVETFSLADSDTIEGVRDAIGGMLGEIDDTLRSGRRLPLGVSTGFDPLDKQIARMHQGDLIVLAGRPAMGKTSLATNIATNATVRDASGRDGSARVAFFSLEMDRKQMGGRVAAQMARRHGYGAVPYRDLRGGSVGQNELAILKAGLKHVPSCLFMDTEAQLTVDKICARAKAKKRDMGGLDLVVIDYLQIIGDVIASAQNRVNVVGQVTGRLKALAKELDCPVVLLSQLSRQVEHRDDKRPHMSDLRDSGSIEQDADVIIFVYRHEYYLKAKEPEFSNVDKWGKWRIEMSECEGRMDAIVSKNRHGPVGTVSLHCELKTDCITEQKEQLIEETLL